ncbi:MAG: hypothetical protein V4719_19320 [Planctomycetota bacterium]
MADERLLAAADLLQTHYGRLDMDTYRDGWGGLVKFTLERQISKAKFPKAWPEIEASWIMAVEEVARGTRSELLDFLQSHGGNVTSVAVLHRMAVWWQQQLDQGLTPFDTANSSLESAWSELSAHDRIWITRLFCVIGGLEKYPLTRASWRVACRHRWLSWYDESEEIPTFFEQGLRDSSVELGQFAEWLIRVGDDYCGPKPKCALCPLQPLLGPNGVCEPEE